LNSHLLHPSLLSIAGQHSYRCYWPWLYWFTLSVEFAVKFPVKGFDIKQSRLDELRQGIDHTLEIDNDDLKSVTTQYHAKRGLGFYR
jgi:hypothetical protein